MSALIIRSLSRNTMNNILHAYSPLSSVLVGRHVSNKQTLEDDVESPIKYTHSPASKWRAESSRRGQSVQRLWYEPFVLAISLAVFMTYFTILREENDLDEEFSKPLISRIQGLEEQQLTTLLEYNIKNGLDTKAVVERLKEIASGN